MRFWWLMLGTVAMSVSLGGWWTMQKAQPQADEKGDLFPFVLPWDDATPSVTNISHWLHKPAGK
ncbi:MAG: hypothetical protein REDVDVYQ_001875, partial [Candidatus Fervidibacter sp.]